MSNSEDPLGLGIRSKPMIWIEIWIEIKGVKRFASHNFILLLYHFLYTPLHMSLNQVHTVYQLKHCLEELNQVLKSLQSHSDSLDVLKQDPATLQMMSDTHDLIEQVHSTVLLKNRQDTGQNTHQDTHQDTSASMLHQTLRRVLHNH